MDEKKLDRQFNRGIVEYRKFEDKTTCPTCNCDKVLAPLLKNDHFYDEKLDKIIVVKRQHEPDNCFRRFVGMLLATNTNKDGTYWSEEKLHSIIEMGLKNLKSLNRKYTEGRK